MDKSLKGKRIVIGGSRKIEEMSALIEKQGGIPLIRPLQGTVFLAEKEIEPDLIHFVETGADWVIFTTGIGIETLLSISEKLGLKEAFLTRVQESKIGARGYKSLAALKKLHIKPDAVDSDGTTKGLVNSLIHEDFNGKKVWIQLHGETAPELTRFFEERGAKVHKLLPYQHISPDEEVVSQLVQEILNRECHAVCFTTATQVRSLFEYVRKNAKYNETVIAFEESVLAVSVGKVTSEALKDEGIKRIIAPEIERMGAMIVELANYFKSS